MNKLLLLLTITCALISCTSGTSLNGFSARNESKNLDPVVNEFKFNGYTTHWQDVYRKQYRYGNVFRMNITDINAAVLQAKADVAEALDVPGLRLEEGFVEQLLTGGIPPSTLDNPTLDALHEALQKGDVIVYADAASETGKKLMEKATRSIPSMKHAHQTGSLDYTVLEAFVLKNGKKSLYAVVGGSVEKLAQFRNVLNNTLKIINEYDLKRGWFGVQTLIESVTCTPGTPIDVMGRGMNEGNSWFVFDGYMEFLAKEEIDGWAAESGLPVVADVGFPPIYNCKDYSDLQVQMMFTSQDWIDYSVQKGGYAFRQVNDSEADALKFNGYYANAGNATQINNEDFPFVLQTGELLNGATPFMVLFTKKGASFGKTQMWDAIMSRRSVAVTGGGFMMGATPYRQALQLLFLDRVFLEEYFGDHINMETSSEGNTVYLTVSNTSTHTVNSKIKVHIPPQLTYKGASELTVSLPAGTSKVFSFEIEPKAEAMNRRNVLSFTFDRGAMNPKTTMAMLELPPAISVHQLLYGIVSGVKFPVSIHNFSPQEEVNVKITVARNDSPAGKPVYEAEQKLNIPTGEYADTEFELKLPAGGYIVTVEALGVSAKSQLGVEAVQRGATLTETDLNNDGINEYILENDRVKATLITAGARVIEYIVKAKNDNVLFKLWPQKPDDDRRPYRDHGFYPYGGFEDFLGQPSIETHKIYKAEVTKREGEYVQVKMFADYYGNTIEKTYTLYGNTPLLEARYSIKMKNPELNVIGPQPIYEIGKAHGPEDKFIIPEKDGLKEYRMRFDRYFGRKLDLREGWNAGYDTSEDIAFISAFPVNRPFFLHMWMNHPSNGDAHYYYAEFQPWTPMFMRTTTYFSYYMWADAGDWEKALQALKDRNLISAIN